MTRSVPEGAEVLHTLSLPRIRIPIAQDAAGYDIEVSPKIWGCLLGALIIGAALRFGPPSRDVIARGFSLALSESQGLP